MQQIKPVVLRTIDPFRQQIVRQRLACQRDFAWKIKSIVRRHNWTEFSDEISRSTFVQHMNEEKPTTSTGRSILHSLIYYLAPSKVILKTLKLCPDLVYVIDDNGNTPLHIAAAIGCKQKIIKALLAAYPEAALAQDKFGRTPLIAACQSHSSGLNEHKPITTPGSQYSIRFSLHYQIVYQLLKIPLNGVLLKDLSGRTALDYVFYFDGPTKVLYLLQAAIALESRLRAQLRNNSKRTKNLPYLSREDIEWKKFGIKQGLAEVLQEKWKEKNKKGWNPIMLTSRCLDSHSDRRKAIYKRMNKIKIGNETEADSEENRFVSLEARLSATSFTGSLDCVDSTPAGSGTCNDLHRQYLHGPFHTNIPLIVDFCHDEVDTIEELGDDDEVSLGTGNDVSDKRPVLEIEK